MSVNVEDLAEALEFYVGLLGFTELPRPDLGIPGAWLDTGAGQQVHLIELPGQARNSSQHWAFGVDDVGEVAALFEAAGHPFQGGRGTEGAGRQLFVTDPSGNLIEFNQPGGAAGADPVRTGWREAVPAPSGSRPS